MATTNLDTELLALERQYWDAIKNHDASTATQLSDDRSIVIGPQGIGELDRQTLSEMVKSAAYELTDYTIEDVHVRPISDDAAVIAYKVRSDVVVEGKPSSFEAFDSSLWVRRDGRWVCALHAEAIKGDPFGRLDAGIEPLEAVLRHESPRAGKQA